VLRALLAHALCVGVLGCVCGEAQPMLIYMYSTPWNQSEQSNFPSNSPHEPDHKEGIDQDDGVLSLLIDPLSKICF
jgi:hypothetical protein